MLVVAISTHDAMTMAAHAPRTCESRWRRTARATVVEQRLYQLIRQPGPIVDRTFEIEFLDAGVEAFAFTFG